ncbi:hypothetical protein NL676_035470 [Syzygium grande]|nr:hypothetical protein NL676_035470 [Syzygium grande]
MERLTQVRTVLARKPRRRLDQQGPQRHSLGQSSLISARARASERHPRPSRQRRARATTALAELGDLPLLPSPRSTRAVVAQACRCPDGRGRCSLVRALAEINDGCPSKRRRGPHRSRRWCPSIVASHKQELTSNEKEQLRW